MLRGLVDGTVSPEAADDWAGVWVDADHPPEVPRVIWSGLMTLVGADMLVSATDYLFGQADHEAWLQRFEEEATLPRRER